MALSGDQHMLNCYFCCQLCLSPINFNDESLSMISEHNKAELNRKFSIKVKCILFICF